MISVAIDLSLRSTGLAIFRDKELLNVGLVAHETITDEELVIKNVNSIINWINFFCDKPDRIFLEGLSFGSKSGSKDIIAGQFWCLRTKIRSLWPDCELEIIPVTSWRSPLFTKEDRKALAEAKKNLKGKKPLTGLKGDERKLAMKENHQLELSASIKEATWNKLDEKTQSFITAFLVGTHASYDARYDITDAIFLGRFGIK